MILDASRPESIETAARELAAGNLVAIPTETVYGLAADATRDDAVAKVFAAKGRPADHPLIVHVADLAAARGFACDWPAFAEQLAAAFWPGPLTLILTRRANVATAAAANLATIGLRCPAHAAARSLLAACARLGIAGLAAPSANPFGRLSPTSAQHVAAGFGDELPVLDGGNSEIGIESAIVDCTRGAPVLLRPGQLSAAQLEAAAGLRLHSRDELDNSADPRAPGTLPAHYAPRAKLRLMNAKALQTALDLIGADLDATDARIAVYSRALLNARASHVLQRRMPQDALACAQQLFSVLHEFDAQSARLIWVETPPDTPDWDGVRDRLERAAAAG